MGTKNNPGQFDCYGAALPDEPMFVLLARDPLAPALVRVWAQARLKYVGGEDPKREEAFQCADAMHSWLIENEQRLEGLKCNPSNLEVSVREVLEHAALRYTDQVMQTLGSGDTGIPLNKNLRAVILIAIRDALEEQARVGTKRPAVPQEAPNNAYLKDYNTLIEFFRGDGFAEFGNEGDHHGWSASETAIEAMRELMRYRAAAKPKPRLVKRGVNGAGGHEAG